MADFKFKSSLWVLNVMKHNTACFHTWGPRGPRAPSAPVKPSFPCCKDRVVRCLTKQRVNQSERENVPSLPDIQQCPHILALLMHPGRCGGE